MSINAQPAHNIEDKDHGWKPRVAIYEPWDRPTPKVGGSWSKHEDNTTLLLDILFDAKEIADSPITLEERFNREAEKWDTETAHISSPQQRFAHPSYAAILGMAKDKPEDVIRLLLIDMQRNRREWFWALSYLTHENPVTRKDYGKLDKMIADWVRWGKETGRL